MFKVEYKNEEYAEQNGIYNELWTSQLLFEELQVLDGYPTNHAIAVTLPDDKVVFNEMTSIKVF